MTTSKSAVLCRPSTLPLAASILFERLSRLQHGSLECLLPGGETFYIQGPNPGPDAALHLHAPWRLLLRLAHGGANGLADAYIAGEWSSPEPTRLLHVLAINEHHFGAIATGQWLARALASLRHQARRNTRAGSRRNIEAHYDLGNGFYRLWLDSTMTYSAALFDAEDQPLADAQRNKYERLLDQLGIRRGDHILEIGCGWGGMAIQAARRGARVTAVTLSTEQLSWARQQASEAGLSDRIEFRLQDYRDLTGQFDHIISIEMVEAVGEAYWPLYFDTLRERLRPGGRAALQVITIDEDYFEDYRRHPDFIQERVFPGGMLPTRRHLTAHASAAGLVEHDAQRFGADYARTLQRWHTAFCRATETVRGLGFDERFLRLWRYYLAYCEAGFSTGRTDLWQLCLERPAGAR